MFCTDLLPKWPTAKHRWSVQKWSDQYPDQENMFSQLSCIHLKRRLRRRAARLKCALAGFFEEQPILQHFTTILILQLSKTVDSKLQLTLSNSCSNKLFPLIPLKGSLSICTFCTSLSDADTRLVVFQQLCTCRSFLPVAFPLRKALQQGAAAQGGFGAPRVIVVLSRPFVDSRLILCSLGLATLRLIGWSIGPRRLAFEAFELALVARRDVQLCSCFQLNPYWMALN